MPQLLVKISSSFRNKKQIYYFIGANELGAEGEIRTPVAQGATGFQDRRRGPLGYLSRLKELFLQLPQRERYRLP